MLTVTVTLTVTLTLTQGGALVKRQRSMPGGMTSGQRAVPELGGAAAQTLTRSVTLTLAATLTRHVTRAQLQRLSRREEAP